MDSTDTTPARSRWLWIAAIWAAFGLFDATQKVVVMHAEGMRHAWVRLFWTSLLDWLPWILATPLILRMGQRYPVGRMRRWSTLPMHLAACFTIGIVAAAWGTCLDVLLNPYLRDPEPGPFIFVWIRMFWNGALGYLILYAFVLVLGWVMESSERLARQQTEAARLNEQLSKAQLSALRRQIEPHFLFNTLNTISGLVRENRNEDAVNMIATLSDMLRHAIEDSHRAEVPLGEELEFLGKYLEIQKMRFAERLQVSVDVPNELFTARVPSLILQPMVENAVKHGIAKRAQGGTIRISAAQSNGLLTMRVLNDGPLLAEDWRSGTGIRNVRTRLENVYGDSFQFDMRNDTDGVEVVLSVPYRATERPSKVMAT